MYSNVTGACNVQGHRRAMKFNGLSQSFKAMDSYAYIVAIILWAAEGRREGKGRDIPKTGQQNGLC